MSDQPKKETETKETVASKNSDKIVDEIRQIIEIVEKIPEYYREKAFEVLLNTKLAGKPLQFETPIFEIKHEPITTGKFIIPIDVKAFLQQFNLPEELLQRLFFMQDSEVRPVYQIKTTKKARSQIQVSLLVALENALKGGKYEFGTEIIRTRCQELKCYSGTNFQANFKNNKSLFKSLDDPEHIELSPDGKVELAEVISEITK